MLQRTNERARLHKLTAGERNELIAVVRKILSYGELSKFEYEAFCRHSVRISLILESWSWLAADLTAAEVVKRALRQIGAQRPRWIEGQREWTRLPGGRVFCANEACQKPIEGESLQARMYCSNECRLQAKSRRTYANHAKEYAAAARARGATKRLRGEIRTCEWCAREFQALDYSGEKPQRFCSLKCRSRFASSCSSAWRPFRLPRERNGRFRRAMP